MEPGYVLELAHASARSVSQWISGLPESSFLFGLTTKNRRRLPITTQRCTQCGFLESFALDASRGERG